MRPRDDDSDGKHPKPGKRTPAKRALRLLCAVCLTALSCEAFYVVAMNVFLSTPLFGKAINATPDIVDIHYTRGWSFFPTRIHARNLSIRGTDSHVEWVLKFDEIEFDCSLMALAKQKFHVTRARGNGITFRARLKVESPAATSEHLAYVPPIDGLGSLGFVPDQPPSPAEWNDKEWHLWTVEIDDAIAEHVHEVWIDNTRFRGDARVAGGFLLKPMRSAFVGPAHVDFRSGRVEVDTRAVAEPVVASLDFELARFDPRFASSADLFPRISIAVDGRTAIPKLEDLPFRPPVPDRLRGRVEIPRLTLRVVKGVVHDGTHVDATGPDVVFTTPAHVVSGAFDVTATVAQGKLLADASLSHLEADRTLSIPRLTIEADSAELALQDPFGDLHGVLDVPDARIGDAARLMALLPHESSGRILRGALRGSLHAEGWRPAKRIKGNVTVRASDMDVLAGEVRVGATLDASAALTLDDDRGSASLELGAPAASVEYGGRRLSLGLTAHARAHAADWRSGALSLDEARVAGTHLTLSDGKSSSALSVGHLVIAAASPHFLLRDPLAHVQLIASIGEGTMNAPTALGDLLPPRTIVPASKGGARFDGDVAVQIVRHVARGAASLSLHGIGISTEKLRVAGDVKAVASVARWDLAGGTLGGDITIGADSVTGGFGSRPGPPDFIAKRIDLRASSASLTLAAPSMRGMDYSIHVAGAELDDARSLNAFLPSPKILAVESGSARISADIATSGSDRTAAGRIDIGLADGGIRLHETHLAGDFAVVVLARGFDPERASVDLEGSRIAMRNVRVTGASTDTSAWSGDLVLQEGTLRLAPTPRLEGDLTLQARDISPILGVLFRDSLPKFVANMAKMPNFVGATHLAVEPEVLEVSDLFASGGDLALRGTYVVRNGDRSAAFVVQKGPLSAGVNLDNNGPHIRLFGLDRWYGEQARQALAPAR